MEKRILGPEFKGGIWHKFFSAATKKDETLASILDEKIRFYKIYYPFLEKKQILGKAYKELGIPHICGDVNRKELYKLFLQEIRKQRKSKGNYKNYPTLFIGNKSRNKGTIKKPACLTTKQTKVNNVYDNVEKSKEDQVFDNLFTKVNPRRKESIVENINLKQAKSVRFNDGIEVHRVSPLMPMYKLKPLGRLFDEPSAIRAVHMQSYPQQELEEIIEDSSDSDFDADTGITSDVEDDGLQDSPKIQDCNDHAKITENGNIEENKLLNTETKTIYDCSEDDSRSMDHVICTEGNNLILSSKMITVAQGKWVRETKHIIGTNNHSEDTIISNRDEFKFVKGDAGNENQEFAIVKDVSIDEHIVEKIRSLRISSPGENEISSDTDFSIDCHENEVGITKVKKEHLVVGNIIVEQGLTGPEIAKKDEIRKEVSTKNKNSKISLENDSNTNLVDDNLLTKDINELSYGYDISKINSDKEHNIEKRIRIKPIKLVDDLIDYINDWNSTNESSLKSNASQILSIKPSHTIHFEKDKCMKTKKESHYQQNEPEAELKLNEVRKVKHVMENKEGSLLLKEKRKKEDIIEKSFVEQKNHLEEYTPPLTSYNNNEQVFSQLSESTSSHNTTSQSKEIMKTEPSSLSNKLEETKVGEKEYETHDSTTDFNIPFSIRNDILEQKKFQINGSSKSIKGIVCNQSTKNPNELYSTIYSLMTKPILVQTKAMETESGDQDSSNILKPTEQVTQGQSTQEMKNSSSISSLKLNNKSQEMTKLDYKMQEDTNKRLHEEDSEINLKENAKTMNEHKLLKKSVTTMTLMDHSKSSLAIPQRDKESGGNTPKILITDQKLFSDQPQNILDDIETTDMYEGHIAIECESNSTNFLSKIQMWSLNSKNYLANSAMATQNSLASTSCNTEESSQVDIEDSIKTTNIHNNESYNILSTEDSLISLNDREDNIFGPISEESNSSTKTVTPVKMEKNNSDEVSTAYETDPETGKLIMNRLLYPIANSTPIKLKQIHEWKRTSNGNGPEVSSTHSINSINENKNTQYLETETENKKGISITDETTIKSDIQNRNETNIDNNPPEYLSFQLRLVTAYNKRETNRILSNIEKQEETYKLQNNKNSALNDFTESSFKKRSEGLSETDRTTIPEQDNNNKFSCKSTTVNSENESPRVSKKEKNRNIETISHTVSTHEPEDKYVIETYTAETELSPSQTCISKIENGDIFAISETQGSTTDQQRCSSEIMDESIIYSNEQYTYKKKVTLSPVTINKPLANSVTDSTDIIYDTPSITDDFKMGLISKTSAVGLTSMTEEKCNVSETESLINENDLNISDELILTNVKRLSVITDGIINNHSKNHDQLTPDREKAQNSNKIINTNQLGAVRLHSPTNDEKSSVSPSSTNNEMKHEGEKSDFGAGMHEAFSNKISKNQQADISHAAFLIRNLTPQEDRSFVIESGCQQLPIPIEILSAVTNIHTSKERNDSHQTSILPNSEPLTSDNNGSYPPIEVQDSQFKSSLSSININEHKYSTRSQTYLSLKRKLETVYEKSSGSDISLSSQDGQSEEEIKMNISSSIQSRAGKYSESSVATDTSSVKLYFKRVNTDIRRKRAKLKKENPVKKSSTSSSEDEAKKNPSLKGKSLDSSVLLGHKSGESNIKFNSAHAGTPHNIRKRYSNQKDDNVSRNFSNLGLSSENETNNDSYEHKALNKHRETEYPHFSEIKQNKVDKTDISYSIKKNTNLPDCSSSIIYSSPNAETGPQNKIFKTEKGQYFSDTFISEKKRNEKSHESYPIYKKNDDYNKENDNISMGNARPNNEYPKKPLNESNPRRLQTELDAQKDQQNDKNHQQHQKMRKSFVKSSIVRWMGTTEASQISNSPEVKTLLRRTYFMGNN